MRGKSLGIIPLPLNVTAVWIVPLLAVATLSLLQLALPAAVIVVAVIYIITRSGRELAVVSGHGDVRLGAGFVIGCGLYVFSVQILIIAGAPAIGAHWTVLGSMILVTVLSSRRVQISKDARGPRIGSSTLSAFSVAIIVISFRQPWMFPFAVPVLLFERVSQSPTASSRSRWLATAGILVGWLLASSFRPDRWWFYYQGNDSQYFEAIGWSIARWGIFEHPGFSGGSIAKYHWLTYAFFGGVSYVAGLAPWDALMKVGGPLTTLIFCSLLLPRSTSNPLGQFSIRWVLLVLVAVVMPTTRTDSFSFSIVVALALLQILDGRVARRPDIPQSVVLLLLSLTLIFTKVSTAAVLILVVVVTLVLKLLRREIPSLIPTGILISSFALTYVAVWYHNSTQDSLTTLDIDLNYSLNELSSLASAQSFSVIFILGVIYGLTSQGPWRKPPVLDLAILLVSPLLIGFTSISQAGTSEFFGFAGLYLATFAMSNLLNNKHSTDVGLSGPGFEKLMLGTIALGYFSGFAYAPVLNRIAETKAIGQWLGPYFWKIAQTSGPVLLVGAALVVAVRFFPKSMFRAAAICLSLTLGYLVGGSLDGFRRNHHWGPSYFTSWSNNSSPFPTEDLEALGSYVRVSTDDHQIFASNNFCCAGTDWWLEGKPTLANLSIHGGESSWGGANYLLPAETRRRYLVQGLRFQLHISTSDLDEQIRRMDLSLAFANSPNRQVASQLKAYGVSYFVVNLSLTPHRDWSSFATEKFRSGNFVLLELSDLGEAQ